jgi:hypothetical protein
MIGIGSFAIAQDIDYKYRTGYRYQPVAVAQAEPAYTYAPAQTYAPAYGYVPAPPPLVGAAAGGLIGAAAGGGPGAAVGAIAGAMIGSTARVPQPVVVVPSYAAPAVAYAAPARSTQFTDQYVQRWQGFMEPAGRR